METRSTKLAIILLGLAPSLSAPAQTQPYEQATTEEPGDFLIHDARHRSLAYPIKYVLFYQTVGLVFLTSLDRDTTGFDEFSLDTFKEDFERGPERDGDSELFNYFLHPLWGSETYLRARSQQFTWFESFMFSTAASIVWEYGMENFVTHPSSDDLLITSTVGSALGEVRFLLKQHLIAADGPYRHLLEVAVDPIQRVTEMVGNLIGQDWREPAYYNARMHQQTASFDWTPTLNADGDLGFSMRYEIAF